jgi:UDP-N-acetylmuramyl pentapeptide phosphotransferase/UDP-N-acetylglucosamine-1-phosphate transferase
MRNFARLQLQNDAIVQYAVWGPLASFAVALTVTACLAFTRLARAALDSPNYRSLHVAPIPRLGGVGVLAGIIAGCAAAHASLPAVLWSPLVLLAAISVIDDVRRVPVSIRLTTHFVAAGWVVSWAYPDIGAAASIAAVLATAWMINLYNFMDGSDGLAGGMALFGFAFYGIAAWLAGSPSFAAINFSIAAAAAAFLCFNFPPARIFLGDVGAVPLGFLAAAFGLVGWLEQLWTWWFPPLVFSAFIVDATITLARRALRRERVWEAHFDHYYQRLVRMGWGHRNTAVMEYAVMLVCGVIGLAALRAPPLMQATALASLAIVYLVLACCVDRAWTRFVGAHPR